MRNIKYRGRLWINMDYLVYNVECNVRSKIINIK
jgi:hypothetical protein